MKAMLNLVVIDGMGPMRVRMIKGPAVGKGCRDDRHCAAHGGGPFFCCRCGAEFQIEEGEGRMTLATIDGLPEHVRSDVDMEKFYEALLAAGVNFHPDDDFHGYVIAGTGQSSFTAELATHLNDLMTEALTVAGADPYAVALRVVREHRQREISPIRGMILDGVEDPEMRRLAVEAMSESDGRDGDVGVTKRQGPKV